MQTTFQHHIPPLCVMHAQNKFCYECNLTTALICRKVGEFLEYWLTGIKKSMEWQKFCFFDELWEKYIFLLGFISGISRMNWWWLESSSFFMNHHNQHNSHHLYPPLLSLHSLLVQSFFMSPLFSYFGLFMDAFFLRSRAQSIIALQPPLIITMKLICHAIHFYQPFFIDSHWWTLDSTYWENQHTLPPIEVLFLLLRIPFHKTLVPFGRP